MRLKDIMSSNVHTVDSQESALRAWETMKQYGVHHLVVVEKGTVVGVLTDRDLGGSHGVRTREGHAVRDLMTDKPLCADPNWTVRQAANRMRNRAIGCLPVVEAGKLKGIITVSDLLDLLGRGLEKPLVQEGRKHLTKRGPRKAMSWSYPR